jgi:hypothetical protein
MTDFKKLIQERAYEYGIKNTIICPGEHHAMIKPLRETTAGRFQDGATEFVQLALGSEEVMELRRAAKQTLIWMNGSVPGKLRREVFNEAREALANFDQLLKSLKEGK